jgi:hypothetical protein
MLEKLAGIGPYLMLELYLARRRLASVAAQTLS